MNRFLIYLPSLLMLSVALLLHVYGRVAQFPDYHAFADQSAHLGIPHAGDVLSNAGFVLVALWGFWRLRPLRKHALLNKSWPGYSLFLWALLLTAFGSAFYHLAPDNARLLWDRFPIALACAGLLAGMRADTVPNAHSRRDTILLAVFAMASVAWWYATELAGAGDLRPYLLLQGAPLVLIPLWQAIYRAPKTERIAVGAVIFLYVIAKLAEATDHAVLNSLGMLSGHTVKHLLATAAATVIVHKLIRRGR
ncbi:MAG: hypothetical protein ACO1NO_13960 [Burkholderiaceae bacterium]